MNRQQTIEKIYPYDNCKLCKNTRSVIDRKLKDKSQLNKFDISNTAIISCPECDKVLNMRNIAHHSRMDKYELQHTLKDYKKIPCSDDDIIEQQNTIEYLDIFFNSIQKMKNNNISLYLHSLSSSLSCLVGCAVLNKFICNGYTVRIYSAHKILDTILDSFKNNNKKYNKWEHGENFTSNNDDVYFDEFEDEYDAIFIHDVPFSNVNGATRIRFLKLLNARRRKGNITILSSQNDFLEIIKNFSLDSYICANLGKCDIAHQQAQLLKKLK